MSEKIMKTFPNNAKTKFNDSRYDDDDVVQASGVMSPKQF